MRQFEDLLKRIGGAVSYSHCTVFIECLEYLEVVMFGKDKRNTGTPLVDRIEELHERVCYVEDQLRRRVGCRASNAMTIHGLLDYIEGDSCKGGSLLERLNVQGIY
jgi:hypothetical protein